jgi:hypothetical protein
MWFSPDVIGLLSNNVVPFLRNLVLRASLFSANVVRKWAMLLVRAVYALRLLQLAVAITDLNAGLETATLSTWPSEQ